MAIVIIRPVTMVDPYKMFYSFFGLMKDIVCCFLTLIMICLMKDDASFLCLMDEIYYFTFILNDQNSVTTLHTSPFA